MLHNIHKVSVIIILFAISYTYFILISIISTHELTIHIQSVTQKSDETFTSKFNINNT